MAGILDVLKAVLVHVPGLSDTNRGELATAIEDFGAKLVEHGIIEAPPAPEPEPATETEQAQAARIADLEAQLEAARAGTTADPAAGTDTG